MRKSLLSLLFLIGGSSFLLSAQTPPGAQGMNIVVAELVEPMILIWRDAYHQGNPNFQFTYQSTMNAVVSKAFLEGRSPFAPFAREMTPEETAAFTAKWGYSPMRVAVAMDALVVLVHKNNPIKEIKLEQLDAIYSTSRLQGWPKDIQVWGDLGVAGSNWASRPIELYGHPEGSGTLDFYRRVVQLEGKSKPNVKRGADILSMIEDLMANQAAIGYGSISQVYSSLKAVPLVPKGGKTAVEADIANVADGSYPLGRILYIYVNKPAGKPLDPGILGFLRFALSKEGQRLAQAAGFVPLPEDLKAMNLRHLDR